MSDFIAAVRSVRAQKTETNSQEDAFLTAVGSKTFRSRTRESAAPGQRVTSLEPTVDMSLLGTAQDGCPPAVDGATRPRDAAATPTGRPRDPAASPRDALQLLRSQPDLQTVLVVLGQLHRDAFDQNFSLTKTGPVQAQIINTVLKEIVPNFWPSLSSADRGLLLSTLRNVAGLNAIVARLRLLASEKTSSEGIQDTVGIADRMFRDDKLVALIITDIQRILTDTLKREMLLKELVNLIGSGKIVGAVAQAEDALRERQKHRQSETGWLSNGAEYSAWVGKSITRVLRGIKGENGIKQGSLLLAKSLHPAHSGRLLKSLIMTTEGSESSHRLRAVIDLLPAHGKRTFTEHLLRWLSTMSPSDAHSDVSESRETVCAFSGLLQPLFDGDDGLLRAQISDPAINALLSLQVRRACFALFATTREDNELQNLLEKLVSTFSSTLFIAHAPVAQQEALAQTILLAAGYVHRDSPMSLLLTARSSSHMQGVSNRLDSSNARARWLGMIVGVALSKMVDKPGSQMDFGTEDMQSEDARWYAALPSVTDSIGAFEDFQGLVRSKEQLMASIDRAITPAPKPARRSRNMIDGKPVFGPPRPPPPPAQTKIVGERITEIVDETSDGEEDLKPYAKPDSDPEDSDEDATLVNRNKARAPVYIRDLMAGLRDDQNFDRFNLSVKTAAGLIRRKAGFGKEVTDHAEELAGMLCNLQDPFDIDDFDDMRLQALVVVLLSDVAVIAPLLARQAFADGYSIAQRCVILSALGLGGRELAGFKIEDEDYNPKLSNADFPSKRLPPRLHALYSSSPAPAANRLEAATQSLEHCMIQPLALRAADQSTSHLNALKVRTFSSRMNVEAARTKRKPPANDLAKCFGERFFFPLANRYQQEMAAYGGSSIYASAPCVLVTLVKTLALLLHASGPATLGLPAISAEMWDLLLSLRVQAIGDISILQAVLFALLTLLEVNTDKQRIAQEHPKQLMETQQWVDVVFERVGGGGGLVDEVGEGKSEEEKVRTLAAGVLMKCREIIEAYQKQLVGYGYDHP